MVFNQFTSPSQSARERRSLAEVQRLKARPQPLSDKAEEALMGLVPTYQCGSERWSGRGSRQIAQVLADRGLAGIRDAYEAALHAGAHSTELKALKAEGFEVEITNEGMEYLRQKAAAMLPENLREIVLGQRIGIPTLSRKCKLERLAGELSANPVEWRN